MRLQPDEAPARNENPGPAVVQSLVTIRDLLDWLQGEFLLPYIDTALRRISHLSGQHLVETQTPGTNDEDSIGASSFDLSQRGMEILRWVGMGKTNHEIGIILDLSRFTVKNHLQRTIRKLNVMNRAQAIERLRACPLPS